MTPGARLIRDVVAAAMVACTRGLLLAAVAIEVADGAHLGCRQTSIDGQTEWVCPDGIGWLFPGLSVMAATGAVSLLALLLVDFRHVEATDRRALSAQLLGPISWVLLLLAPLGVVMLLWPAEVAYTWRAALTA